MPIDICLILSVFEMDLIVCSAGSLNRQMKEAFDKVDVVVTSGGVSMGEKVSR